MKFITVNPTWNVPPSIIANEYLPAVRQDPSVLERMGLRMEQNRDGTVRIYQPPGDRNALGRIRFNFPNKFLVYQHDTPDKHLFAHDKRAYSHGCMRVENPLMYGEKLLSVDAAEREIHRRKAALDVRPAGDQHQLPADPAGASDLPDRVRGRCRHAADPRRHLRPRRPPYRDLPQRRAQGRRYRDRPAVRPGPASARTRCAIRPREASPFADWFSSRQPQPQQVDRRGNRVVQSRGAEPPSGSFFGRLFR